MLGWVVDEDGGILAIWHICIAIIFKPGLQCNVHWRRSENNIPAVAQPSSAAAPAKLAVLLDNTKDDDVQLALATLFGTVPPTLPAADVHRPVKLVNVANMCWLNAALQVC